MPRTNITILANMKPIPISLIFKITMKSSCTFIVFQSEHNLIFQIITRNSLIYLYRSYIVSQNIQMKQRSPESKALSELKKISELQTINKWDDPDILTQDWLINSKPQIPKFKIKATKPKILPYRTQRSKTIAENNPKQKQIAEISQIVIQDISSDDQHQQITKNTKVFQPIKSVQKFQKQPKLMQCIDIVIPQNQKMMNLTQRMKTKRQMFKEEKQMQENSTVILGMKREVFMKQMFRTKVVEVGEQQIRERMSRMGAGGQVLQSSRQQQGCMMKLRSKESIDCLGLLRG